MNLSVGNAQDIGAREEQQDAFAFSDWQNKKFRRHGGVLGVLADGMGGIAGGADASRTAVRTFLESYESKSTDESIPAALLRALNNANRAVLDLAKRENLEEIGSTLVAAVAHDSSLYWISAGDSRLYLFHNDRFTRLNNDHVYANELNHKVAEGKISNGKAQDDPQRAALTSYLGLSDLPAVDRAIRPLALETGDSVLLCSDGVYNSVTESEMTAALRGAPQKACESLVQAALSKQKKNQDNLTAVSLRLDSGNRSASADADHVLLTASIVALLLFSGAGVYAWRERLAFQENRALTGRSCLESMETHSAGNGDQSPAPERKAEEPDKDQKHGAQTNAPGKKKHESSRPMRPAVNTDEENKL
jgi:protein phosphatase